MDETKLNICRLCLKLVCKNEYRFVEEQLLMIKTIFMDLNWTVSENPIMCSECLENLRNCYEFKSSCLSTEEYIHIASNDKQGEVDLWQIRIKSEDDGGFQEKKICRFCLKPNNDDVCYQLEEKDLSFKLQKCLPELDLFIVRDPVTCQNCFDALESLFSFVTSCLDVENSINTYRDVEGNNSNDKVNLYDVLQFTKIKKESDGDGTFTERFIGGNKFEQVSVKSEDSVKEEGSEAEREVIVKTEPMEFDESESSVKNEEVDVQTEMPASGRKKRQRKELTSSFSCSQCDFTTKYKRNIRLHIMVIHSKPEAESLNCNECSYHTFYPARLKAHLRLHTQDLPYACEVCYEKYNHRRYLDSHIVTKHPDSTQEVVTKIHKCTICNFKTVYATFLTKHVLMVHDNKDVKTFKCDKCVYSTDKKCDLKRHVLTHAENKPFVCPACSRGFTTKTHLDSHILNRHSDKEDAMKLISSKIHYCRQCDYKAVNPTNLHSHVKSRHQKVTFQSH